MGFTSGDLPKAPANHALVKNYSIVGLHWGLYNKVMPKLVAQTHDALVGLFEKGEVDPLIHEAVPFEELLPDALALLGSRKTRGKLVTKPTA